MKGNGVEESLVLSEVDEGDACNSLVVADKRLSDVFENLGSRLSDLSEAVRSVIPGIADKYDGFIRILKEMESLAHNDEDVSWLLYIKNNISWAQNKSDSKKTEVDNYEAFFKAVSIEALLNSVYQAINWLSNLMTSFDAGVRPIANDIMAELTNLSRSLEDQSDLMKDIDGMREYVRREMSEMTGLVKGGVTALAKQYQLVRSLQIELASSQAQVTGLEAKVELVDADAARLRALLMEFSSIVTDQQDALQSVEGSLNAEEVERLRKVICSADERVNLAARLAALSATEVVKLFGEQGKVAQGRLVAFLSNFKTRPPLDERQERPVLVQKGLREGAVIDGDDGGKKRSNLADTVPQEKNGKSVGEDGTRQIRRKPVVGHPPFMDVTGTGGGDSAQPEGTGPRRNEETGQWKVYDSGDWVLKDEGQKLVPATKPLGGTDGLRHSDEYVVLEPGKGSIKPPVVEMGPPDKEKLALIAPSDSAPPSRQFEGFIAFVPDPKQASGPPTNPDFSLPDFQGYEQNEDGRDGHTLFENVLTDSPTGPHNTLQVHGLAEEPSDEIGTEAFIGDEFTTEPDMQIMRRGGIGQILGLHVGGEKEMNINPFTGRNLETGFHFALGRYGKTPDLGDIPFFKNILSNNAVIPEGNPKAEMIRAMAYAKNADLTRAIAINPVSIEGLKWINDNMSKTHNIEGCFTILAYLKVMRQAVEGERKTSGNMDSGCGTFPVAQFVDTKTGIVLLYPANDLKDMKKGLDRSFSSGRYEMGGIVLDSGKLRIPLLRRPELEENVLSKLMGDYDIYAKIENIGLGPELVITLNGGSEVINANSARTKIERESLIARVEGSVKKQNRKLIEDLIKGERRFSSDPAVPVSPPKNEKRRVVIPPRRQIRPDNGERLGDGKVGVEGKNCGNGDSPEVKNRKNLGWFQPPEGVGSSVITEEERGQVVEGTRVLKRPK